MSEKANTATEDVKTGGRTGKGPRGRVAITIERCKGCEYCVEFCPMKVLAMSSKFNSKGYHYPEIVDQARCSGCDLCGMYCPDFAIVGWRIPNG